LITFFIPGEPVAKGRPRAFKMHNGHIGTYTPDKTAEYEAKARYYAAQTKPEKLLDGPLAVTMQFAMTRPKSTPKGRTYPTVKPDLDNLEKAVLDAMNGLIYTDDSRVVLKRSSKEYALNGDAGVRVTVEEI
jgi:Holliday junction resolvase RusA-like endonuclease